MKYGYKKKTASYVRTRRYRKKGKKVHGLMNYFGQKPLMRKLQWFVPVYVIAGNGTGQMTGSYSFPDDTVAYGMFQSATPNYTAPTVAQYGFNIARQLSVHPEFLDLSAAYSLMKINGIRLQFISTLNPRIAVSSTDTTVRAQLLMTPCLYFDILPSIELDTSGTTNFAICSSDSAYKIQPKQEDSSPVSKYYTFPKMIASLSGYPSSGKDVWIDTYAYSNIGLSSNSWPLHLGLGSFVQPTVDYGTASLTSFSQIIGHLEYTVYVQFGKSTHNRNV